MKRVFTTATYAIVLFCMLIGPMPFVHAELVKTTDNHNIKPDEQQTPHLEPIVHSLTLEYFIHGIPDEINTWDEWVNYRDNLSDEEKISLKNSMWIEADITINDITITVDSLGIVQMSSPSNFAFGEVQYAHNEGAVVLMQDMDQNVMAKYFWSVENDENELFFADENKMYKTFRVSDIILENSDLRYGEQDFKIIISPQNNSVIGGDLMMGQTRFFGIIFGAIVAIIVVVAGTSIKCVKDGLWDPYDCTPGTVACYCNGCERC